MIMEKKQVQISAMRRRADVNKIFDKMKSTGNFNLTKDVQEKLGFNVANIDRSKLLRPKSAGAIPSPSRAKRSSRAKGAADGPDSGLMSTDPPQADQAPLRVGGEVQVQAQAQADDGEVRKEPRVLKTRRARPMSARPASRMRRQEPKSTTLHGGDLEEVVKRKQARKKKAPRPQSAQPTSVRRRAKSRSRPATARRARRGARGHAQAAGSVRVGPLISWRNRSCRRLSNARH